jgi:phosphoribosyl 1,2-cyclic phosphate phosphodiesterase
MKAELTILGSGTSMGVPTLGCDCRVCTSSDPRDRRLRPAAAVQWEGHTVLIDTGPDFREQALREHIRRVDAVLYTHAHADHILGLDDLRPLSFFTPRPGSPPGIPLYADPATIAALERIFDYHFSPHSTYPMRARVRLVPLKGQEIVKIAGATFQRVPILHGELEVAGFRFGNAAYLTDMNVIPDPSLPLLQGLEVVVLDALRREPHASHSTLDEAIAWVEKIQPRQAWFTHMSHDLHHADTDASLPPHIRLAYDGLRIPIEI